MLTAAFCLLVIGAEPEPVETFEGYPANENVLWVHLPKYTSRRGVRYTWEPKFRIGNNDSHGGAFIIDDAGTKSFLMNLMNGTKKRSGYIMTSTIAQERDDALAVSAALKKAEQAEQIAEEEYERWLYEKQLEVWRIRIEENKALSEQEKARALNRIANAINNLR